MRLQDKVAVITGAGSGIGLASVQRFLSEGVRVAALDVSEAKLAALPDVGASEKRLETVLCDVTRKEDCEAAVARALQVFGRVDAVVNCAGINTRSVAPDASAEARWDAVVAVNLKGTMYMCQAGVEAMRRSGGGAIVNIASIMGVVGYPPSLGLSNGFSAYSQSKGAVVQLTRDLGAALAADGIRVNAIAAGFVETPLIADLVRDREMLDALLSLHPLGRLAKPQEIASVVAFLCSDDASFVTGAIWAVDGGYTAV